MRDEEPSTTHGEVHRAPTMTTSPREDLVRVHGRHAQAQATLQRGMAYVDVDTPAGRGYAAYAKAFGQTIILGEPVCHRDALDEVVAAVCRALPGAVFFQVGSVCADVLRQQGLTATPIGIEPVIRLPGWVLEGRKKQTIRTARNRAKALGIVIAEWRPGDGTNVDDSDISVVVAQWHRTRRRRTLRFLVPPMSADDVVDGVPHRRRLFVARDKSGALLGFVAFDLIVDDGDVVGFTPSVSVSSPQFRPGLWYALMAEALAVFRAEGVPAVNLGLLPLSREGFTHNEGSASLRLAFRVLRFLGSPIYNFKGIDHAKRRFDGDGVLSYMAHRGPLPVFSLAALLWLTVRGPRHRPTSTSTSTSTSTPTPTSTPTSTPTPTPTSTSTSTSTSMSTSTKLQ